MLAAAPGLIISARSLIEDPKHNGFDSGVSILCTAPFFLIGLAVIGSNVAHWISEWRIGKPELSISRDSIHVGGGFSVSYSHTFRQKADVKGIKVSLIKRERATYSSGTSSTMVEHEEAAAVAESPARLFEAGDSLSFSRTMEVPHAGMHTFKSKHNEIIWLLKVKVNIAGWPDYMEDYEIDVCPASA